jgi:hypothetical protein
MKFIMFKAFFKLNIKNPHTITIFPRLKDGVANLTFIVVRQMRNLRFEKEMI